jgi:hypothetical protein
MKTANIDKIPPGPELDALVAEKVMGWKNVHRHGTGKHDKHDRYTGRKQCPCWSRSIKPSTTL